MSPTNNGEHTFQLILQRFDKNDDDHLSIMAEMRAMRDHVERGYKSEAEKLDHRIDALSDRVGEVEKTIENYRGRIFVFGAALGIIGAVVGRIVMFAIEHINTSGIP